MKKIQYFKYIYKVHMTSLILRVLFQQHVTERRNKK